MQNFSCRVPLRDNSCTLLADWLCNTNKQTIKHTHHHSNPHTRVGPQPLLSTLLYLLLTSCSLRLRCELLCTLGDLYHLTFFSHIIFSDNVRDSSSSKYISLRRVLLSLPPSRCSVLEVCCHCLRLNAVLKIWSCESWTYRPSPSTGLWEGMGGG